MFKTPNRQIYLLHQEGLSFKIVNISTGKILYDLQNYFSDLAACLFHSMPIANSFIVAIIAVANELIIHVIDLIKEKVYEQRCSVEKIKESILSLSKNDKYYEELKSIFYVGIDVKSKIDTSTANLVIYNEYVVNIKLNALKDVISLIATYRNNELDVRFQVNKKVKLVTSSYTHEIDLGVTTILTSDKYEIDSKYNILQSRLYSVIISYDDYTIIYESNGHEIGFALYRKNESYIILPYKQFDVNNLGDIMLIRIPNKILACGRKNSSIKTNRVNRYYVECVKDDSSDDSNICHDINVIETKVVRDLLLARIFESNGKNWVSIDITDKVKRIHLKNELEKAVQFYTRSVEEFSFFDYACYIDYGTEEFYSLVFLRYKSTGTKKYRVYLFKCKIDRLLSNRNPFILVWNFETSVLKSKVSNILHNLNRMISSGHKILRLLSKKFGKGIRFIGLKIFEAYDKSSAYHDYGYNRRSIRTSPKDSSIATTLHLVRRMLPTF